MLPPGGGHFLLHIWRGDLSYQFVPVILKMTYIFSAEIPHFILVEVQV